jgi:hypothetical protein
LSLPLGNGNKTRRSGRLQADRAAARLAVYSASTGRLEKYLTTAQRGQALADPQLSGRTEIVKIINGNAVVLRSGPVHTVPLSPFW